MPSVHLSRDLAPPAGNLTGIAEETPDGILLRPAVTIPIELYGPERTAEFILAMPSTRRTTKKATAHRHRSDPRRKHRSTKSRRIELPEKDWPILGGAVAAGATHLITGDVRHFGRYFGHRILGVLVLPPARYLRSAS